MAVPVVAAALPPAPPLPAVPLKMLLPPLPPEPRVDSGRNPHRAGDFRVVLSGRYLLERARRRARLSDLSQLAERGGF
jgi:hypothetical protein